MSLAAALVLPEDVVGRDRIVLITFALILVTLLVQGLSMPAVVRWARLPTDPDEQDEHQLVDRQMSSAALRSTSGRLSSAHPVMPSRGCAPTTCPTSPGWSPRARRGRNTTSRARNASGWPASTPRSFASESAQEE